MCGFYVRNFVTKQTITDSFYDSRFQLKALQHNILITRDVFFFLSNCFIDKMILYLLAYLKIIFFYLNSSFLKRISIYVIKLIICYHNVENSVLFYMFYIFSILVAEKYTHEWI